MSLPYFCTKCGRQHLRGAIYIQHKEFDTTIPEGVTPESLNEKMQKVVTPLVAEKLGVKAEDITWNPNVMEVVTPTKEEVLAAVDVACAQAAIPDEYKPTIVNGRDGGTVERWGERIEFQKHSEFPDRAIESVQHEPIPAMKHGEPIKKSFWRRLFRR